MLEGEYHSAFGGEDATTDEIIGQWENHLCELAESGDVPPDHLRQEMARLMQAESGDNRNRDTFGNAAGEFEDEDVTEFDYSALGAEVDPHDEEDNTDMDWAEGHDFQLTEDYTGCVPNPLTFLQENSLQDQDENAGPQFNVQRDQLNAEQRRFVDIIDILLNTGQKNPLLTLEMDFPDASSFEDEEELENRML